MSSSSSSSSLLLRAAETSKSLVEARIDKHCSNLIIGGVSKPDMYEMFKMMNKRLGYVVCLNRPDWEEGMELYGQFKKCLVSLESLSRNPNLRVHSQMKYPNMPKTEYGTTLNDCYAVVGTDFSVASDKFYSWMDKFANHLEGKDVRIGPGIVIDDCCTTNNVKGDANKKIQQLLSDIVKEEVFPTIAETGCRPVRLHQFSLSYHVDHERLITLFSPPNCTLQQEKKQSGNSIDTGNDDSKFVLEIFTNSDERIRQMCGSLHDVATTFVEMMPARALVTRTLQYLLPLHSHSDEDYVDEDEDYDVDSGNSSSSSSGSDEDESESISSTTATATATSTPDATDANVTGSRRRKVQVVGEFIQVTESICPTK